MRENTFTIGLTMAGAISAGAYTAGVLDQLIRALDAHERARAAGLVRHRVVLKAISGASAGGVSAALAVAALIRGLETRTETYRPVAWDPFDAPAPGGAPQAGVAYETRLGPLHDVWVERLRLYDATGGGLLGDADLRAAPEAIFSALDSEALDAAADAALAGTVWTGRPYAFVAEPLELFFTVTNLNGAPYRVRFGGGDASGGHRMANHAFARHFRVSGLGSVGIGSHWLETWRDDGIALTLPLGAAQAIDLSRRPAPDAPGTVWTEFRETAMATGAFPGGLAARVLRARMDEFCPTAAGGRAQGGAWALDIDPAMRPQPVWGDAAAAGDATHVAVDGGACNNEPFELARFVLREKSDDPNAEHWELKINERAADRADRAVLMIDPFPEGPEFTLADPADAMARAIGAVAGRFLGALVAQARLKPGELVAAADEAVHSRFLIAPRREAADGSTVDGAAAIACGGLGGFAGFFDEAFRRHDFVLGQHNCRSFLKNYFNLAPGNPVFGEQDARGKPRPIVSPEALGPEIDQPPWPRMPLPRLEETFGRIGARLDRLFEASLRQKVGVGLARWALRRLWALGLREAALDAICRRIEAELLARDQILADLPADAADATGRRVLAALVGPGPHLRTVEGVARQLAGDAEPDAALRQATERALRALRYGATPARYRLVAWGTRRKGAARREAFHLEGRGPGWIRRLTPGLEITDDLG